jgi:hypothetical protein
MMMVDIFWFYFLQVWETKGLKIDILQMYENKGSQLQMYENKDFVLLRANGQQIPGGEAFITCDPSIGISGK